MATRFAPDFDSIIQMMSDSDEGPFMTALLDLLGDINKEHQPDQGGKCKDDGCANWQDPEFSIDWPCAWWLNAMRVAVGWLMERAVRTDSERTPDGIQGESEGNPEDRAREQARARKARQRQRERESQESATPQVGEPCPLGTDGGVPQGLADASQVRSQGDSQRDRNSEAPAVASAVASAKQVLRQVP